MIRPLKDNSNERIIDFSTFDLGCAAALISVNFELVSIDKQNPRKVLFIFGKKEGIDKTVKDYFSGKLKVSARALLDTTKMLKNLIYSNL